MNDVFYIIPASSSAYWTIGFILAIILVPLAILGYAAYSARNVRFTVTEDYLRIQGDLYGRSIPLDDLDVPNAQILDLGTDSSFAFRLRTNGIGLPGYRSGWFKLRNGEKALAFVTDKSRVVYVPTRRGYGVMMSAREPGALLSALERVAAPASPSR